MYRMASYATSGVRMESAQDSHCLMVADTAYGEIALAVICDGVGGLREGELASSHVVKRFSEWFERDFPRYALANLKDGRIGLSNLKISWGSLLAAVNDEIRLYGADREFRLGTTFSGLLLCQGRYFFGHVGDCRIYQVSSGSAQVLTHDQTFVAREVAEGRLSPDDATQHPRRNVLLQAVGAQREINPEFGEGDYYGDALFVLCCDGFYRDLGDKRIREAFSKLMYAGEPEMARACEALSKESIASGSTDNVTVLCLCNADLAAPRRWADEEGTVDLEAYESTAVLPELSQGDGDSSDPATTAIDLEDPATTTIEQSEQAVYAGAALDSESKGAGPADPYDLPTISIDSEGPVTEMLTPTATDARGKVRA